VRPHRGTSNQPSFFEKEELGTNYHDCLGVTNAETMTAVVERRLQC
jgi:hypothetical protein